MKKAPKPQKTKQERREPTGHEVMRRPRPSALTHSSDSQSAVAVRVWRMAQTVCVLVSVRKRQLKAIVANRNCQRKHIERARVILASAERGPVQQIAAQLGVSRPMVWRWQQRFAEEGVDGLLRDKTRKPGKPPIPAETVQRVVALTCGEPPGEITHWTGRAMAKAVGISLRSVQRIWEAHRLQPHRVRTFKRSRDPEVHRETGRCGRPLPRPAGACRGAVDR